MSSAPFEEGLSTDYIDSGYNSPVEPAYEHEPEVFFSKKHLAHLNKQLSKLGPDDILRWAITTLPALYQETAFGLSGLVTLDLVSKLHSQSPLAPKIDLIFIDTLHHFPQTLSLVDRVRERYPEVGFHIYKPTGVDNAQEFAARYGDMYWDTDEEQYDFVVKVEPGERARSELGAKAILTGRRKTQGGKRGELDVVEIEAKTGLIKVNPLANWTFEQVADYIRDNQVPYNELLDQGYKSIGDWHSTQPVLDGESERAGRWKGKPKEECGIHNPKSRYAQYLMELERKKVQDQILLDTSPVQTGPGAAWA